MSTIEITDVSQVREGDVVTLAYRGHSFTGEAWNDPDNEGLNVGADAIKWYGRLDRPHAVFIRATREVPDLPTEPGSVIVNATIKGVSGLTAILDQDGLRRTWLVVGHPISQFASAEDIAAWTPARIVAEDGAS